MFCIVFLGFQPDVHPGQCWAFRGTQGFLVIQLAGRVKPTAFSLEHIPRSLSPTGKIDSAPKDFTVWVCVLLDQKLGKKVSSFDALDMVLVLHSCRVQPPPHGR